MVDVEHRRDAVGYRLSVDASCVSSVWLGEDYAPESGHFLPYGYLEFSGEARKEVKDRLRCMGWCVLPIRTRRFFSWKHDR
jgi:hypothetical protein